MPRTLVTTHVVKTPHQQQQIATPPSTPSSSSSSSGSNVATVMWSAAAAPSRVQQSPLAVAKPDPDYVPVTPTSSISSLPTNNIALTPSSSGFNNRGRTTAAIAIVKQEGHRLMTTKPNNLIPVGAGLKMSTPQQQRQQFYVATTPGASTATGGDHEYGQYSTPQQGKKTIYLTPSSSGGGGGGPKSLGPTSAILLSAGGSGPGRQVVRSEARRKLNLDAATSAPVLDPEGFKTPIKSAAKRKAQDMSSPSPKKRKLPDE